MKYEVIKERAVCPITGAHVFIEQVIDRDNDIMWSWSATIPKFKHGSLVHHSVYISGDMVLTRRAARSTAWKEVAAYLKAYPQKYMRKDGTVR